MITPINGIQFYSFEPVSVGDEILLVVEKDNFENTAIAAYNQKGQKIGILSTKSTNNEYVFSKLKKDDIVGKVWNIGRTQILVELDY